MIAKTGFREEPSAPGVPESFFWRVWCADRGQAVPNRTGGQAFSALIGCLPLTYFF